MGFDLALSGIRAEMMRLQATAHNVANVETPGFAPFRIELAEQTGSDGQGAGVAVAAVTRPEPPAAPTAPSAVDLPTQMVEMITAQRGVEANVRTIRAEDDALQSLQEAVK